jgi:hypothetical protein
MSIRRTLRDRLKYPWPVYRKVGGIRAVVTRADGTVEDLGVIAPAYAKRWRASSR